MHEKKEEIVSDEKLEELCNVITERNATIKRLTGKHVYARKVIKQLLREKDGQESLCEKISRLEELVAQRDAEISRLNDEAALKEKEYSAKLDGFVASKADAEIDSLRSYSNSLLRKIEDLERELKKREKKVDGKILIPLNEFNELCDSAEEADALLAELKKYEKQMPSGSQEKNVFFESEVNVTYEGVRVVLPNSNHLYRTYEVFHALKLRGEPSSNGIRLRRSEVLDLMSETSDDSKEQAYVRWKRQLQELGIEYNHLIEGGEAWFYIKDLAGSSRKISDLLTLREIYSSGAWKSVKRMAKRLGLNINLEAGEAMFKYPSQSSPDNEMRNML